MQLSQGYCTVYIDGVERGELWGKQVRVFDVSPGTHDVQVGLGWGWVLRSRPLSFTVEAGQTADLVCARILHYLDFPKLRVAREKDIARMQKLLRTPPVPRNLAMPEGHDGT
jgi:hypothetical protein